MKKQHKNEVISKLETLNSENNQDFWPLLKKLRNNKKYISSVEMVELITHFEALLNKPESSTTPEQKERLEKVKNFINSDSKLLASELQDKYTESDILKTIESLKNGKSAYSDGILNEVLKSSKSAISEVLTKLFNLIEDSGNFPKRWSGNFLVPLLKVFRDSFFCLNEQSSLLYFLEHMMVLKNN